MLEKEIQSMYPCSEDIRHRVAMRGLEYGYTHDLDLKGAGVSIHMLLALCVSAPFNSVHSSDLLNAELSPERCWQGPVFREWRGGGGGYYTLHYTVTTRKTSALRWAVMRATLMLHLL